MTYKYNYKLFFRLQKKKGKVIMSEKEKNQETNKHSYIQEYTEIWEIKKGHF